MKIMKILFCFLVSINAVILSTAEFCDLKWPKCGSKVQNIVCERNEECGPEEGCQKLVADPEFLKHIVHEHNRLRNSIATGIDTRGYTGKASNMMAISYNKDLEYTARCNVNTCKFAHDRCRGSHKFRLAGQNMYFTTDSEEDLKNAVQAWFEEITLMTPDVIDKFPRGRHDIGHFTQVIWAKTTHVGCAKAKSSSEEEGDKFYLTCNYGPTGNMIGRSVYLRGDGCTNCPANAKCNVIFPSVCGDIDETQIYATRTSDEELIKIGNATKKENKPKPKTVTNTPGVGYTATTVNGGINGNGSTDGINGTFINGTFVNSGINGTFFNETFHNGIFVNGTFVNGTSVNTGINCTFINAGIYSNNTSKRRRKKNRRCHGRDVSTRIVPVFGIYLLLFCLLIITQ